MYCFNFEFNKKVILVLGLLVVLCLSMSMVNATNVHDDGGNSSIKVNCYYDNDALYYSYDVSSEADFKKVFNH